MDYPIEAVATTRVRFNTNARNPSKNRATIMLDVELGQDLAMASDIGWLNDRYVRVKIENLGFPENNEVNETEVLIGVDENP